MNMGTQAHPNLTDAEGLALERELATSAATSDIECHAIRDSEGWYQLDTVEPGDAEWVARAVRYLDWRGLIVRDPADSNRILIKDAA